MNTYPSWMERIPEMIEALALLAVDRIDRQTVERLFDLRKTAAFHLLRRLGAERYGNSLTISRARLMARLREAQEQPDWRWERERREQVGARIDDFRPGKRRSLVRVEGGLQHQIDHLAIVGLPDTIQLAPGSLTIRCLDMNHLVSNWFWWPRRSIPTTKPYDCESRTRQCASP